MGSIANGLKTGGLNAGGLNAACAVAGVQSVLPAPWPLVPDGEFPAHPAAAAECRHIEPTGGRAGRLERMHLPPVGG